MSCSIPDVLSKINGNVMIHSNCKLSDHCILYTWNAKVLARAFGMNHALHYGKSYLNLRLRLCIIMCPSQLTNGNMEHWHIRYFSEALKFCLRWYYVNGNKPWYLFFRFQFYSYYQYNTQWSMHVIPNCFGLISDPDVVISCNMCNMLYA